MANPLASSQAHKFACGLASVGVGLGGPVVDEDVPMAEVCLERGQVALGVTGSSGRLELVVPRHGLSLDEVLDNHQLVYCGVNGHAQEEDRGAEFGLLQALEANVIELDE